MRTKILIALFCLFNLTTLTQAQEVKSPEIIAYIEKYKDIAILEMKRAKIPASITIAQGILESGFGKSVLALNTNNHFGIKCHQNWTGKTFKYNDDAPNECFRVYDDPIQSYKDHSDFLVNRSRYANLFTLDIKDYKAWAYGLKEAGYATNPKYPELLIKYIETYSLDKLDNGTFSKEELLAENYKKDEKNINKVESVNTKLHQIDNKEQDVIKSKTLKKSVVLYNKLKAVKVFSHDDLALVAQSAKISLKNLLQYNDLDDASIRLNSQYIYLEPKRTKAKHKTHLIKKDDTMWKIAQRHAIQLDALLKLNKMSKGEEPKVGELINLKKPIKVKPQLRTTPIQNKTETIPNKQETIKTTSNEVKTTVSTSKDTIYKNIPKQNTSVDEEKVLSWEEGTKLVENNPVKPFPDTKIEEKIEPIKNTATNLETIEVSEKKTEVSTPIIELKKVDPNASVHLVEKGDTLYNISKRYGITVAQLIEWNNIQDNVVKLGTYLKVK